MMIDPTFRARKSVFCFDERILCLGSGITSEDGEHRVCTTLFQHPREETQTMSQGADWVLDGNGNGYYVPKSNDPLDVSCEQRALPYHNHWFPSNPEKHNQIVQNEGVTELALLDHGKAPRNGKYEYCVLMRTDVNSIQTFAERMTTPTTASYRILQQNTAAHIVYDVPSATTAYVLFEPGTVDHGPVRKTSAACLVMTRLTDAGHLRISVCDPDIGPEPQTIAPPTELTLTLAGEWTLPLHTEAVKSLLINGRTELTITCREARPVAVNLIL